MTIAISTSDYERIRRTAQKKGVPYTVWAREVLLRAVDEGGEGAPRGWRRAVLHALGKDVD